MSATVDTKLFLNYFPGCVHVSLNGRMFPVEEFHLENILYNLNYKTKEMEKLKKSGLTTRSMTTIEELSTKLSNMSSAAPEESDDVVVEESDIEDLKVVDTEMDKILEDCFLLGEDEQFESLHQKLLSDGDSIINYSHSVTGRVWSGYSKVFDNQNG